MPKVWPIVLGIAISILAATLAVSVTDAQENRIPSYEELPDGVLINKTKELPEVKAFLAKYPGANVGVDRSGRLTVDYKQHYSEVTLNKSGTEVHPYIRLRIFMTTEGEPIEMYADCRDVHDKWTKAERDDVLGYLETETCFR
ncbi:MAG TPA: hypothetical protein VF172_03260 [Nitrososphaera sp.]|jgi:hypothetical protein